MQTQHTQSALSVREHFTDSSPTPAYLNGLREGLELTTRHYRMNLAFAFVLGVCITLAIVGGVA